MVRRVAGTHSPPEPGWTFDTLRMHMEAMAGERDRLYHQRIDSLDRATALAIATSKEAVVKAETATDRRLEGMNEIRQAWSDDRATLATRTEVESQIQRVMERLGELTKRITELTDRVNRSEGKGIGLNAAWLIVIAVVSVIGVAVSIYVALGP